MFDHFSLSIKRLTQHYFWKKETFLINLMGQLPLGTRIFFILYNDVLGISFQHISCHWSLSITPGNIKNL